MTIELTTDPDLRPTFVSLLEQLDALLLPVHVLKQGEGDSGDSGAWTPWPRGQGQVGHAGCLGDGGVKMATTLGSGCVCILGDRVGDGW